MQWNNILKYINSIFFFALFSAGFCTHLDDLQSSMFLFSCNNSRIFCSWYALSSQNITWCTVLIVVKQAVMWKAGWDPLSFKFSNSLHATRGIIYFYMAYAGFFFKIDFPNVKCFFLSWLKFEEIEGFKWKCTHYLECWNITFAMIFLAYNLPRASLLLILSIY